MKATAASVVSAGRGDGCSSSMLWPMNADHALSSREEQPSCHRAQTPIIPSVRDNQNRLQRLTGEHQNSPQQADSGYQAVTGHIVANRIQFHSPDISRDDPG